MHYDTRGQDTPDRCGGHWPVGSAIGLCGDPKAGVIGFKANVGF
jgi:hypothetical protein